LLSLDDGDISYFEIVTVDPDRVEDFAKCLESQKLLPKSSIGTWKHSNPDLLKALEIENVSMFIILSLIVLVAVSNALASLVMTVREKVCEIAILRTIGATKGEILLIFVCNGLAIGMIGIVSGSILAFLLIFNVPLIKRLLSYGSGIGLFDVLWYFFDKMPISINFVEVSFVICFSSVLSFLATLYPAYKAASIDPAYLLK